MSLDPGHELAHYEILEPIGKGGMGEVYRARDSKLGRDVAIKVLPNEFAQDVERLRRFQREAKVLASLNHPNIASIYGLEHSGDSHYLVLELVPGETLAERIARGAIPLDEALAMATKIAEALEEAHEQGIVHRDLKPANVKLTPDDKVVVLDFGLAKAFAEEAADADSSMSPTITRDTTRVGTILGTAAYMSPEQAKGKNVDKRADIFAFGAVLYEMLTGKKAFPGEDVSEVLAAILKLEPDWTALSAELDPRIRKVLRRCLEKDRTKRVRDIGDARHEIEEIVAEPAGVTSTPAVRALGRERLAWLGSMVFALATLVLGLVHFLQAPPPSELVRFSILPPSDTDYFSSVQFAVAPDGRSVAFVGLTTDGGRQLGLRPLDSTESRLLPGTDDIQFPFWSPDSQFIGYFAEGKLKKVRASGGPSETLCDVASAGGASWNHDDVIIFGSNDGIFRVGASGGLVSRVTALDDARQETSHRHPQFLPDGNHFLFLAGSPADENDGIYAGSLEASEIKRVLSTNLKVRYAHPGYLLFTNQNDLWAQRFDVDALEVSGAPFPLVEHVRTNTGNGGAGFSASENGVLTYHAGRRFFRERSLVWMSRGGREVTPIVDEPVDFPRELRLSPDGGRLALITGDAQLGELWVYPLDGRPPIPLAYEGHNVDPIWSPDGTRIAFVSRREGAWKLFWVAADGSSLEPDLLSTHLIYREPPRSGSWSPDGKEIVVGANGDIVALALDGQREPRIVVGTEYEEGSPRLSPNGKWLAYWSNVTGRREIWARPYPGDGAPVRVTSNGGDEPVWSRDGRELFYLQGNRRSSERRLMVARTEATEELRFEQPRVVFDGFATYPRPGRVYDVAPDGRFVTIQAGTTEETDTQAPLDQLDVIINWTEELKRFTRSDD